MQIIKTILPGHKPNRFKPAKRTRQAFKPGGKKTPAPKTPVSKVKSLSGSRPNSKVKFALAPRAHRARSQSGSVKATTLSARRCAKAMSVHRRRATAVKHIACKLRGANAMRLSRDESMEMLRRAALKHFAEQEALAHFNHWRTSAPEPAPVIHKPVEAVRPTASAKPTTRENSALARARLALGL